jgi:hypothetical protein
MQEYEYVASLLSDIIKITDLNGLKDISHDNYAALFSESLKFIYHYGVDDITNCV